MLSRQEQAAFTETLKRLEQLGGEDDWTGKEGTLRELGEAKKRRLDEFRETATPVGVIVNTALVINWKWETAKKRIDRFNETFPHIDTLDIARRVD